MITMIEHGEYKTDIPMTFIRGYIRGYSKLVGIPDKELHDAMESMKPKPEINEDETSAFIANHDGILSGAASITQYFPAIDIGNVFMQLFTCLLAITLVGLVAVWWHSHKSTSNTKMTAIAASQPSETSADAAPDYSSLATSENNAAAPTETPASVIPVATIPAAKAPTFSNPKSKAAYTQLININRTHQILMSLILFLIIITASMRIYAKPNTGMASLRKNRTTRSVRFKPDFNFKFNFNFSHLLLKLKAPSHLTLALSAILLCGLGFSWWYEHNTHTNHVLLQS